jgi:hypothetical protein
MHNLKQGRQDSLSHDLLGNILACQNARRTSKENLEMPLAFHAYRFESCVAFKLKRPSTRLGRFSLAGETGLEPATNGFGDRYSTN